jgi:putative OPT family oligopeptide transporter
MEVDNPQEWSEGLDPPPEAHLGSESEVGITTSSAPPAVNLAELPLEEREKYWFQNIYQGEEIPQLTVRSVIMGSILGAIMCASNLYVGLKTGWALGVSITACILAYSFCKASGMKMGKLEMNCMASTASSAGYSTGGTMVSGVAAYLMLTQHHMSPPVLILWTFFLACLGVFMAIPMKRQMIDVEQLKFPTGTAAAETLKSLHDEGAEAVVKARSLTIAAVAASLWKIILTATKTETLAIPGKLRGIPLGNWTIALDLNTVMIAAGAIVGWKVAWSMLLGACLNFGVLAPIMYDLGALHADKVADAHTSYREIVSWSTWTGTSIMVTSSLLMFALQWRTVGRAFAGLFSVFSGGKKEIAETDAIEVPSSWFLIGGGLASLGCIAMLVTVFDTKLFVAVVAVALSFVLALVACRATGESDITPMGAMGKVAQLTFGVMAPSNMVTNLMTAGVTAGAASSSADLLTDLKSGYLLGANPRRQFLAQFLGIFAGTVVVVPLFYLLIPNADALGTATWPAPAAVVWTKVAQLLKDGLQALHYTAQRGLLIGGIVGLVLPILDMKAPKAMKPFIPSATGLGLAFVIGWYNSFSMFIGALLATLYERFNKASAERYVVPVSSGVIAGESLTGVAVALAQVMGWIG